MELVIILAVVAAGIWYFFYRNKETIKELSENPQVIVAHSDGFGIYPVAVDANLTALSSTDAPAVQPVASITESKSADDRVEATAPVSKPEKSKRVAKPKVAEVAVKPKATLKPKAPAKPRAKKLPTRTVDK